MLFVVILPKSYTLIEINQYSIIPEEYISQIKSLNKEALKTDEENQFTKSCFFFLLEGEKIEDAIGMAMTEFITDI